MNTLFGIVISAPEQLERVLEKLQADVPLHESMSGLGIGYYAGDQALIMKRPSSSYARIDRDYLTNELSKISSPIILAHNDYYFKEIGPRRAPPFRFNNWLFDYRGDFERTQNLKQLEQTLPDFLKREIIVGSDNEILFSLFLKQLHEAHLLENNFVSPAILIAELKKVLLSLANDFTDMNLKERKETFILTNGNDVIVYSQNQKTGYRMLEGGSDVSHLSAAAKGFDIIRQGEIPSVKVIFIVSELSSITGQWQAISSYSFFAISQNLQILQSKLDIENIPFSHVL